MSHVLHAEIMLANKAHQLYYGASKHLGRSQKTSLKYHNWYQTHKTNCQHLLKLVTNPEKLVERRISVFGDWWYDDERNRQETWITGDHMLRFYMAAHGIDHWIRMEHLVDDFVATFQRLRPLTEDDIAQIHRLQEATSIH